MPVTCENWLSLINSCIYDARQTCEIYQVTRDYVQIKTIFTPKYIENLISQLNSVPSTILRIAMGS